MQILAAQPSPDPATRIRALNAELTAMGGQPRSLAVNRLRDIVRQRQAAFAELAETDTAQALALLLPEANLAPLRTLPQEIAAGLESEGSWSGPADVVAEDDFEHQTSRVHISVQLEGERVSVYSATPSEFRSGDTIETAGVRMGRILLARRISLVTRLDAAALSCSSTGTQHLAILLVNFKSSSINTSVVNSGSMSQIVSGATHNLTSYWNEASYGLTSAAADVFGPFTLTKDYTGSDYDALQGDAFAAAAASVNFANYTHVVIVMPNGFPVGGGLGTVGCRSFASPTTFTAGVVWVRADFMVPNDVGMCALAHENGHNMGLNHASTESYGSVPLGGFDTVPVHNEYGSFFSLMSQCFTYNTTTLLGHYDAPHKVALGWFVPTNYQTVSANGSFVLSPMETNTTSLHAIRVQRGQQNNLWLWLEYRKNQGYDSTLGAFDGQIYGGAMIHLDDPANTTYAGYTRLLNFSAPAKTDFSEPALTVGSSWSDPYSSLTLSVPSADAAGLHVTVQYDTPCATLGASSKTYTSPNAVTADAVSITAAGTCSWTASSDQSWITVTAGASGTGSGTVVYSLTANSTASTRTGIIAIGRQSFTITQPSSNPQPTPVSASPINSSSVVGTSKTFTLTYSDAGGAASLASAALLFSADGSRSGACAITWMQSDGTIRLTNDQASGYSYWYAAQNGQISNSQCVVNFSNAVTVSGNNFTMTLQIQFTAAFVGTKNVYMEATDTQGVDSGLVAKGTWSISTSTPNPSLKIAKSHTGNFTIGQSNGLYTVVVSNAANVGPTSGTVTVTETVPTGMTLVSMAGTGWTCASGGNKCTRSDALPAGTSYSPITVTVNISSTAPSSLANQVSVSGGGSTTASTTDATTIVPLTTCDVTRSGGTSVMDIQEVLKQALGMKTAAADVNQDGKLNVVDSQIALRAVLTGTCVP